MENVVHNNGCLVYHYTSLATFKKLLDGIDNGNFVFHASNVRSLNDTSEFIYGFKELRRLLPNIEDDIGIKENKRRISCVIQREENDILHNWNDLFTDILMEGNLTPFVVSMSASGDSIPMWSMYGDQGRGISIGFDVANIYTNKVSNNGQQLLDFTQYSLNGVHAIKIQQNLSRSHPAYMYSKMIYSKHLKDICSSLSDEDLVLSQMKALCKMAVITSAYFKHPGFMFENEWRIIGFAQGAKDVLYKINSNDNLVPYIKLRLPISSLRKVILGPCFKDTSQKNIIANMIRILGITSCKVVLSKMPLR